MDPEVEHEQLSIKSWYDEWNMGELYMKVEHAERT